MSNNQGIEDESTALMKVRFTGYISDRDDMEWKISRISLKQIWPPTLMSLLKNMFSKW